MIHPTAIIHPEAILGADVSVGAYSVVERNVRIGAGTVVESHCIIGHPSALAEGQCLDIGEASLIRSHSIFYQGSMFGPRLVTGHRVTVREKTVAGTNLQIGTVSDLQGHCTIGDYVRLHSNVHIGQHSRVGDFVWLFPYVVLTNDPHPPSEVARGVTVEDYAAIATMSVILPGITVGCGALVAAHSSVSRNVQPDTVVGGAPARLLCQTSDIKLKSDPTRSAYPWRRHFHRGYPDAVVEQWLQEFSAGGGLP